MQRTRVGEKKRGRALEEKKTERGEREKQRKSLRREDVERRKGKA